VLNDIRYAMRGLRRNPGFTAIAVATLALGIGANTAIFSIVNGVLLRPLPFADPGRLVQLNETVAPFGIGAVAYPDLDDFRRQSTSFEAMIAYVPGSRNLQDIAEPERIATVAAERGLFRMLGIEPVAGRTFRDDDPSNVVVIGAGFAKRHFAGDPSPVGSKITLDGEGFTVIGVMPDRFQFPYRTSHTELWIPWEPAPQWAHNRSYHADFVAARLKPGVGIDAARNELGVIAKRLEAQYPDTNRGRGVRITPLSDVVVGPVRNSLLVLLGAVGLVLLVSCANVANLLLARATARTREVAIRAALGAGRLRLIRQFLTESVLLALGAGLLAIAMATWGTDLLLQFAANQIPRSWEIGLDWHVLEFLLGICVITGIGFGLAPAISAARADLQTGLKETSGRASAGRGRLRDGLVVAEVSLAFVLLVGAGLLLRTFLHLQATPTGMVTENVLTLHVSGGAAASRYRELEERVTQIPGVRAAGFTQFLPLQDWNWTGHFTIDGRPLENPARQPVAELRFVTPGYFHALGIPLLKGRGLTDDDTSDTPPVILINEALARQYFPNENPIGRHTDRGTIVGVVGDVHQASLDRAPAPEIYHPVAQNAAQTDSGMSLVVSAKLPPEKLVSAVRAAIHEVDPRQVMFNVKTMQRVIADSLSDLNLYLWLMGLFAGLALLLATAGIYGVVSYAVSRRTHEIGIRMALGAERWDVLGMVLRRTLVLAGVGVVFGTAGALAVTRVLAKFLFDVKPTDPATFAAVAALLGCVAVLAGLIPARRASGVDPVEALRYE